jgi:acetyl-CoA acyltransferase
MSKKAYVVGVGMTKFMKPSDDNPDYPEMAKTAATRALYDAKVNYN